MAQLFSLGHETVLGIIELVGLAESRVSSQMEMSKHSTVSLGLARAGLRAGQVRSRPYASVWIYLVYRDMTFLWPNKSPEPTAAAAFSSAVAVHAASRRWLSFLR